MPHVYEIATLACTCQFADWQIANNIVVGYNGSNEFDSADANIGDILEKQVLVPLENVFYHQIYCNPQIKDKHGFRELTDVFAFHDYGVFLIETKAIIINDAGRERNMERKIKGLQKQVLLFPAPDMICFVNQGISGGRSAKAGVSCPKIGLHVNLF